MTSCIQSGYDRTLQNPLHSAKLPSSKINPLVPIPCHTWKVKGVPPRTSWDCWYTWTEKLLVWTKADNIRRERRVRQCYRCHSTRRKTRLIIVLLTSGIATNSCNRRCKLVLIIRVSRNGLDISSISYRITGSKTNRWSTWYYQVGKVIQSIHVKISKVCVCVCGGGGGGTQGTHQL